jgi:hypothetical protein
MAGMVELHAYAADCCVIGQVELSDARLSDQLNRSADLQIYDVRVEDLADGHVVMMPELTVAHEELCAVVASGPRGDTARRLNTRTTRVEVEIGPYRVEGRVHSPPAGDPFGSVLRRGTWVPLTEAIVIYSRGDEIVRDKAMTLLVNRHLMRLFREF